MAFFEQVYDWTQSTITDKVACDSKDISRENKQNNQVILTWGADQNMRNKLAAKLASIIVEQDPISIGEADRPAFARSLESSGGGIDAWWHFRKPLDFLWKRKIECPEANEGVYRSSSSCLIKRAIGGYYCMLRSVNYNLDEITGAYDFEGVVRTRNWLITMNDSLYPLSCEEVKAPPPISNDVYVFGLEDARIFGEGHNYINMMSTTSQYHKDRKLRILSGKVDVYSGNMFDHHVFETHENGCEKNWTPVPADFYRGIIDNGTTSPYVSIHTIHPHRIIDMETEKDYRPDIFVEGPSGSYAVAKSLRGSSVPVSYKDGYLFIVHNVGTRVIHSNHVRVYYHRMVYMYREKDESGGYVGDIHMRISDPFTFHNNRVEFCLSICWHEDGLLVNYSEFDKTSVVGCLSRESIENILWP